MAVVPPRQTPWHYTLGRRCSRKPSDPPFPRRGSRVLEDKYQSSSSGLGLFQARAIPHTLFTFHEYQDPGQNIILLSLLCHCNQKFKRPE